MSIVTAIIEWRNLMNPSTAAHLSELEAKFKSLCYRATSRTSRKDADAMQ